METDIVKVREKLANDLLLRLGDEMIDVELTPHQLQKCIDLALAYLESKNYLSDERFARVWLNNRKINHSEGRIKLLSELLVRGISKNVEKIISYLINSGFSVKLVNRARDLYESEK